MTSTATVTIGPSALKVFGRLVTASVAIAGGAAILVGFFQLLAAVGLLGFLPVPSWVWASRWVIVACLAALLACYCGFAVLIAVIRGRPRVEIGLDGFVDYGIVGRRSRRWSDIEGSFSVIRVGWPIGVFSETVVAYRLTDVFKESSQIKPVASLSLAGNDEAILICGELAIGPGELADVLTRWKQAVPSATPSE